MSPAAMLLKQKFAHRDEQLKLSNLLTVISIALLIMGLAIGTVGGEIDKGNFASPFVGSVAACTVMFLILGAIACTLAYKAYMVVLKIPR